MYIYIYVYMYLKILIRLTSYLLGVRVSGLGSRVYSLGMTYVCIYRDTVNGIYLGPKIMQNNGP